jgi:hypothetical protein
VWRAVVDLRGYGDCRPPNGEQEAALPIHPAAPEPAFQPDLFEGAGPAEIAALSEAGPYCPEFISAAAEVALLVLGVSLASACRMRWWRPYPPVNPKKADVRSVG